MLKEKIEKILNELELDDDGACGDPECCGETGYFISHESKKTATQAILEAVKLVVPKAKSRNDSLAPKPEDGWNQCRALTLKNIEGE